VEAPTPLRVVIADDSAFIRRLLADSLERSGFSVVATAEDGDQALAACRSLRPDVLTLDLAMPGLDGIGVLRALRDEELPVPVLVVSAFSLAHGARAVDALAEGAVDLVPKPGPGDRFHTFLAELEEKVRLAAGSQPRYPSPTGLSAATNGNGHSRSARARTVVIASSTGGPRALAELLPKLPSPLGTGTVIVQHMPAGFTGSLAERLDRASSLSVREARPGDGLDAHTVLVAPGGHHLRLLPGGAATLSDEPTIGGLRPRADLTIGDAARVYGRDLLLVVLTGMGKDGLEGAHEVHANGGRILAEAESSCTVYGMPRAIVEAGLADGVYDLSALPAAIALEAGA